MIKNVFQNTNMCVFFLQTLAWLNASGYSNIPMNKMLSNEDILDKYWKLQVGYVLRFSQKQQGNFPE